MKQVTDKKTNRVDIEKKTNKKKNKPRDLVTAGYPKSFVMRGSNLELTSRLGCTNIRKLEIGPNSYHSPHMQQTDQNMIYWAEFTPPGELFQATNSNFVARDV